MTKAQFFRVDDVYPEFEKAEPFRRLVQLAFEHSVYLVVKRSNITRGWTYNAEISFIEPTGRFYTEAPHTEIMRYSPHGVGAGRTPLDAVIDACRLCQLKSLSFRVAILEAETWMLARAERLARERHERISRRLDFALTTLAGALHSYTEDDDL